MLAKLVCKSNKNLQRVFTKRSKDGFHDLRTGVEITSKRTKTKKDGSVVMVLGFENGRSVEVTYRDLTE